MRCMPRRPHVRSYSHNAVPCRYAYAKYVESLKSKQPQLSSSNKDSDSQD